MAVHRKGLVALTLLCAAGATATAPASADDLSAGEIRAELVGRSILWWEAEGWQHGWLHLGRDGRAEMTVDRPVRSDDTGRWSLRGGELCTEWGVVRSGTEKCYTLRKDADGRFVTSGGNVFEVREAGV